jgi:alanine-synthesizing transaminase
MTPASTPLVTRERLREVRYEIRGELARRARELEARGHQLIKLNIGNPGAFGFRAPEHMQQAIATQLPNSDAYTHQQGLPAAREALAAHYSHRDGQAVLPEQVFLGNGVSELIDIALRALLNHGDEVLLPSPDYPLWSAATILNDGVPLYYDCRAENGYVPDPEAIEALITPRTRALVVINPNNPTGATYPRAVLERFVAIAAKHQLLLLADEIYEGILYDGAKFIPMGSLAGDVPCLSFGGLSKLHRACGWRVGWGVLGGDPWRLGDYMHSIDLLSALRLCSNVPGQWAIPAALDGPQTIAPLCAPGGRLYETRRAVIACCEASRYLDLVAPDAALYAFPSFRRDLLPQLDDHRFALELLEQEHVLIVPGSSFNVPYRNHFRITLLPEAEVMHEVFARIERALARHAA